MRLPLACILIGITGSGVFGQTPGAYIFTTLAGRAGFFGSTDGTGADARFNRPWGVAVDAAGNVYVTEAANHLVRKITPAGVVTTLAGQAETPGAADGVGAAAQFGAIATGPASFATALSGPFGIVVHDGGTLIVADGANHVLRSITPGRLVSTFAGTPGTADLTDGPIANSQFRVPLAMARDAAGMIYVADCYHHAIRRISTTGVVTTIAGGAVAGSRDGIGSAAHFLHPSAIAVDGLGNVYVADSNSTIRRLSPSSAGSQTWTTTTIAGEPATFGLVDATGSAARFGSTPFDGGTGSTFISTRFQGPNVFVAFNPTSYVIADLPGLAADAVGNVYVADYGNNAIRKVSPAGVVTTVGGSTAGGSTDGSGAAARFSRPAGVAIDAAGTLYVADHFNNTIRKGVLAAAPAIQSQPASQTVAVGATVALTLVATGGPIPTVQWARNGINVPGATSATLTLTNVQFAQAGTYVATVTNSLGSATTTPVVLTVTGAPIITLHPVGQTVNAGQTVNLSVTAAGDPAPTYQWLRDGNTLAGATGATLTLINVQAGDAGEYRVVAINASGSATSNVARVVVNTGRIVNLSIRTALTANQPLTVGFVTSGGSKPLLVRAVGPTLGSFGVTGAMPDPRLNLFSGPNLAAANDNWSVGTGASDLPRVAADVGAFALPATSLDAALLVTTSDGAMTAQALGGAAGIVLLELYDTAPTSASRLINVSARGRVGTGDSALFAGFVLSGNTPRTLLIRGVGPSLGAFGVTGVIADPRLDVYAAGASTPLAGNDNWGGSAALVSGFVSVGAFALPSTASLDAALRITLNPGGYTVRISGVGNSVGEALLEVYEVP